MSHYHSKMSGMKKLLHHLYSRDAIVFLAFENKIVDHDYAYLHQIMPGARHFDRYMYRSYMKKYVHKMSVATKHCNVFSESKRRTFLQYIEKYKISDNDIKRCKYLSKDEKYAALCLIGWQFELTWCMA